MNLRERQAARRYRRMTRVHPIDKPTSRLVGEDWPDVPVRDRLAWWLANTALKLASRQYRGRLRRLYLGGLHCRVAHMGIADEARNAPSRPRNGPRSDEQPESGPQSGRDAEDGTKGEK